MRTATLGGNCLELDRQQRIEAHAARVAAEFQSRADAKPMKPADVSNVERVPGDEAEALMERLKYTSPKLYRDMRKAGEELWDWPAEDSRWDLTPHELKKLRRRQAV